MFAIIRTGGKQYKVQEGDKINVEKLDKEEGSDFIFDDIILIGDDKKATVGQPVVKEANVKAKIIEQGKGDKKIVFKYKSKTRQKAKKGHRQPYTRVEITKISLKAPKESPKK